MFKRDIEGVEWYLEYELEEELRDWMLVLELGDKGYLVFDERDKDEHILEEIQNVFTTFTKFDYEVLKAEGKVEFEGNIIRYITV